MPESGGVFDVWTTADLRAAGLSARDIRVALASGRLVQPQEVAEAVAYLASPTSASTNGVILAVDGGAYSLRSTR